MNSLALFRFPLKEGHVPKRLGIGLPFKNKPPFPLVALFGVGGTPAFEILTV
jgi:hypothetical protein